MESSTYDQDNQEQEENVGDIVELEPQVLGHEGYGCILGRSNLVTREGLDGVTILVDKLFRQRLIEKERSVLIILLLYIIVVVLGSVVSWLVVTGRIGTVGGW